MDFAEYQKKSRKTAKYPNVSNNFVYPALGLCGEAGEVADKFKKYMRDDRIMTPDGLTAEHKEALKKELGDVLWYIAQLATELEIDLDDIATHNIEKLYSRMERDTLGGSGDNR